MSVYNDVYVFFNHNTKVCFCVDRLRSSEKYVRELCSHHGTAPSICKAAAERLFYKCFRKRRTSHMSHMQRTCNFTVDRTWCDFIFDKFFFLSSRHSVEESLVSERFTIFHKAKFSHLVSQIINVFSFCFYAPFFSDAEQLFRIFYLIVSAFFCAVQCVADFTTVIRVSSCTTSCEFQEVSSYDTVCIASANSSWSLRCNTTWSHSTDSATDTLLTELTVWSLILYSKLPCVRAYLRACL